MPSCCTINQAPLSCQNGSHALTPCSATNSRIEKKYWTRSAELKIQQLFLCLNDTTLRDVSAEYAKRLYNELLSACVVILIWDVKFLRKAEGVAAH